MRHLKVALALILCVAGPLHAALDFNGSTQRIDAGNPSLGLGTTYTVSAWVRPDVVDSTRTFTKWGSTTGSNQFLFLFGQVSADVRFFVRDDAAVGASATKTGVFSAGVWAHCAGTRSGNNVQVYVDGVAGTGASASIGTTSVNNLRIGAADDGTGSVFQYWDGRIAELAIWSVALTADEITSLARGMSPLLVRPSSLVLWTPLVRDINELRSGVSLTNTSPTAAEHPRIYR